MPRPGPRPYECIRRAWHSESHQSLRGSLTQEIFRIVTDFHGPETRSKKEWQEKLPIVVLRAEEILYSKARSEAEYSDVATLKARLDDAVNTMIRRTDENREKEDGPYMEPCVEAALSLGCTPKMNPRGQRGCPARLSGSANNPKRGSPISSSNSSQSSGGPAQSSPQSSCSPCSSSSSSITAVVGALNPTMPSLNATTTNAHHHHLQNHQEHQNQNQNQSCLAFLNLDATWPSPAMAAAAPPAMTEPQPIKSSCPPPFVSFPEFTARGIDLCKNPQQDFTFVLDHPANHSPAPPFGFRTLREESVNHGPPAASCSSICLSEESSDLSYAHLAGISKNRIATGFGNPYLRFQGFQQNQHQNSQESHKNNGRILASIFPTPATDSIINHNRVQQQLHDEHDLELCLAPPKISKKNTNNSNSIMRGDHQIERIKSPSSTSSGSSSSSMSWRSSGAECLINPHPDCSKRKAFGFPPPPPSSGISAGVSGISGYSVVLGGAPVANSTGSACFEVTKRPREFPF